MQKSRFAAFGAVLDVHAARLIVHEVGAGRNLDVSTVRRHPHFDVVSFCGRESEVARRKADDAVRKSEFLQNKFGFAGERLEFVVTALGHNELDEFDFIELVLTDKPAGISARRTGLASEASGVRAIILRKVGFVHDVAAEHIRNGNFGGRDKEIIGVFDGVSVLLELRKLSGTRHAVAINHERRENFGKAVCGVRVEHKVPDCALQPCAEPAVNGKSCARDFGGGDRIENIERGSEIPMRFRLEVEFGGFEESADFHVFGVVLADRYGRIGNIRNGKHRHAKVCFDGNERGVEFFDLVAYRLHFCDKFGRVLFFLFEFRDLSRFAIAFGFENLDFPKDLFAARVEPYGGVHVVFAAASFHGGFYFIGVFHNEF